MPTDDRSVRLGRFALREEGESITGYYAAPETMDGAFLLFSVPRHVAEVPGVKDAIFTFGRRIISEMVFEVTGVRPTWPEGPQPAPEHERSGRA